MLNELQFSNTVYALGASMFFWGYFLFEVPSNLLLHRFGARFCIARIMLSWTVISMAVAYTVPLAGFFGIQSSSMFYVLRFLLGVCEAGFYGLAFWMPSIIKSSGITNSLHIGFLSVAASGIVIASAWTRCQRACLETMSSR
ncbi:putative MFS-type transporter [Pseudomonas orientalis]|nr:putative MFS-type transporter [Pseudomonas orientalis]